MNNLEVKNEKIVCAAIWYKSATRCDFKKISPNMEEYIRPANICEGIVICGYNHTACIDKIKSFASKKSLTQGLFVFGFITAEIRFVFT